MKREKERERRREERERNARTHEKQKKTHDGDLLTLRVIGYISQRTSNKRGTQRDPLYLAVRKKESKKGRKTRT